MKFISLTLVIALLSTGAARAQELEPGVETLTAAVQSLLPAWWDVDSLSIVAKVNDGDAINPNWRFRLEAEAVLDQPLFLPDPAGKDALAPFGLLIQTLAAGTPRRIYATGGATYRAGQWDVLAELETSPEGLGQPADLFPFPALVAGTPEASAAQAQLSASEDLIAAFRADASRRQVALETALAEQAAAFENTVAASTAEFEAARNRQQALLDRTMADLAVDLQTRVAQLGTSTEQAIAEMQQAADAAKAELEVAAQGAAEAARIAAEASAIGTELSELQALEAQRAELAAMRTAMAQAQSDRAVALAQTEAAALTAAAQAKLEALSVLRTSLTSDDPGTRRTAFAGALASGEWVLQREALAMLIAEGPTLGFGFVRADQFDGENFPEQQTIHVTAYDPSVGVFEGQRRWSNGSEAMRGTIGQGGLVIDDRWCKFVLEIEDNLMQGPMDCGNDKFVARFRLY